MDPVNTPEGFFARGTYKGKLMFTDADSAVHLMYNYKVKIAKQWWNFSANANVLALIS